MLYNVNNVNRPAIATVVAALIEIIRSFFSPEYRKQKEQNARDRARESKKSEALNSNQALLESIIENCPSGHVIFIKFPGGNWSDEDLIAEAPELVKYVVEHKHWAYAHGSGLICLNPDDYNRDPNLMARVIWAPTIFLEGQRIRWWRYVKPE